MKYRHTQTLHLLAILGFSMIYGCSVLGPKKIQRPHVPPDLPFAIVWLQPKNTAPLSALSERELAGLVLVKKWTQGDRDFVGYAIHDGKVYLSYPNVVYVKWEETQLPDGRITKYASEMSGGDGTIIDQVREGRLPVGVLVLDMDAAGIDPYEYLSK